MEQWKELAASISSIETDCSALDEHRWRRFSTRNGSVPITMSGHVGRMGIAGNLTHLLPYLVLTEPAMLAAMPRSEPVGSTWRHIRCEPFGWQEALCEWPSSHNPM